MKIYHQAGHNTNWNLESFENDDCGDGIIFSPVHYASERFRSVVDATRNASLFDPQFYIPDSQKIKLNSYEFFPEKIMDGFSTKDFEAVALQSAEMCLDFQLEKGFEAIMVPARYFSEMTTDYIAKQKAFSIEPFLVALGKKSSRKPVYLTLPVTFAMTQDNNYRQNLLNWITSYPEIQGVYYLNEIAETTKQLTDYNKLKAHIDFIKDLQSADLMVIIGYCNTESVILSLLDPFAVTIGAYENTRSFSIDKFLQEDGDVRGPAPRLYFPKLLNWMRYDTALEIKEDHPDLWDTMYSPTDYSEAIFKNGTRPHFTKPEIYKHHFLLINKQLNKLRSKSIPERFQKVQLWITRAMNLYQEIENKGIIYFDRNCSGDHLPVWNRAVKKIS